jgi:hypothetical protein
MGTFFKSRSGVCIFLSLWERVRVRVYGNLLQEFALVFVGWKVWKVQSKAPEQFHK